jgi:ComF family protein
MAIARSARPLSKSVAAMVFRPRANVNQSDRFMSTMEKLRAGARRFAMELAAGLLPPVCCLCGFPGARPAFDLCSWCGQRLPRIEDAKRTGLSPFRRVVVPFLYADPVDRFVRGLKFRGEHHYARLLGELLADEVQRAGGALPQMIVPVPLHSSRYRLRGFNQSQEIARFAAFRLGLSVDSRVLVRNVATAEQSGLPLEERRRNVQGAFRLARSLDPIRIALVDDVLTTGNTVQEAARPLIDAGVHDVELWAIARVVLQ